MNCRHAFVRGLIIAAMALGATPSLAANPDLEAWTWSATATRTDAGEEDLKFNLAGGLAFAPIYLGSDEYEVQTLPLIDIEWRRAFFLSTQRGLGVNIIRSRNTRAGPRLTWSAGRKSSSSTVLAGMSDLASSIEFGGFIQYFTGSWRLDADIRYGLNPTGHNGVLAGFGAALGGRLSERSTLFVGGRFHWAGADYMIANFGVKSSEAVSGRPSYVPTDGLRDIGGFASIVYTVTKQIYFTLDGRADIFMSSAADSPITKTTDQFYFGTMIGIRF